jgi:hypothetical protein
VAIVYLGCSDILDGAVAECGIVPSNMTTLPGLIIEEKQISSKFSE